MPTSVAERILEDESALRGRVTSVVGARNDQRSYEAYQILKFGFIVAPIIAGLDKFANYLVTWDQYLAPWIAGLLPISTQNIMRGVGVIEVIAGALVAVKPRIGAYVVGVWLMGIVVNLLIYPAYFDIALRDFGLALGAFALARLSAVYDPPRITIKR